MPLMNEQQIRRFRKDLQYQAENYTGEIAKQAKLKLEAVDEVLNGGTGFLVKETKQ